MSRTSVMLMAATVAVGLAGITARAAKVDARLAAVRHAYVVPKDPLADDQPVAACLAKHLPTATPVAAVDDKTSADVVFTVAANIPGATHRALMGMFGGTPSAHLTATLPDGTKLWDDGAKLRRALDKFGRVKSVNGDETLECGLADELLKKLRDLTVECKPT